MDEFNSMENTPIEDNSDRLIFKKYEHLYQHTLNGYNELANADKQLEEKSWKYFTVLSLLIGFQLYFLNNLSEAKIIDYKCIDWFLLVISMLSFLSLAINWFIFFNAVNIRTYKNLPMTGDVIEYYNKNRLLDINYSSANQLIQMYNDNSNTFNEKCKNLKFSISFLNINSIFIVIEIILLIIKHLTNG